MDKQQIKKKIKNLNVLFVDDDEFVVELMQDVLKTLFNKAFIATNGQEGLQIFKQNNIDIIITDMVMPIMDGEEMIKQIQNIKSDIKVVFISGYAKDTQNKNMVYITKPISYIKLLEAFEKIV